MWNFIDIRGTVSFKNGGFDKNIVIFGADVSSPVHVDNKTKEKDILILGADLTQALNFTEQKEKKFGSSLHYNGSNSHLFVNG